MYNPLSAHYHEIGDKLRAIPDQQYECPACLREDVVQGPDECQSPRDKVNVLALQIDPEFFGLWLDSQFVFDEADYVRMELVA